MFGEGVSVVVSHGVAVTEAASDSEFFKESFLESIDGETCNFSFASYGWGVVGPVCVGVKDYTDGSCGLDVEV